MGTPDFLSDTMGSRENSIEYARFLKRRLKDLASAGIHLSNGKYICLQIDGVEGREGREIQIGPSGKDTPLRMAHAPPEEGSELVPRLELLHQIIGGEAVCRVETVEAGEVVTYTYRIRQKDLGNTDYKRKDIRWYGWREFFDEKLFEELDRPKTRT